MDALLKRLLQERYQLSEHMEHNELHQYIDDNADDLLGLLNDCIQYMSKGAERNERDAA